MKATKKSGLRKMFGKLADEYENYLNCEGDKNGRSIIDGKPPKDL